MSARKLPKRSATSQDAAIGRRIRAGRMAAGLSQAALGEALGVSFQQVQKYEKGTNRVGADRITVIAAALKVPVMQLLAPGTAETVNPAALDMMATREGCALAEAFNRIDAPEIRRSIVNVVRLIADLAAQGVDATVAGAVRLQLQAAE